MKEYFKMLNNYISMTPHIIINKHLDKEFSLLKNFLQTLQNEKLPSPGVLTSKDRYVLARTKTI